MRTSSPYLCSFAITMAAVVVLLSAIPARAQSSSLDQLIVQQTAADRNAALAATTRYRHAYPANTAAAQALSALQTERPPSNDGASDRGDARKPLQYFGDATNQGGHVVKSAVSHAIYLQMQSGDNCTIATCWGDPEGFLRDLGKSDFVHLVDQYVGLFSENRYTVGFNATVNYIPQPTPLLDTDIQAVVHAVAAQTGASGYGHIYHVFLPPGQDECFDSTLDDCYSPDNNATFFFCAYHSSADFPDIGHILYTVQPYANTPACEVQPGTPNGSLVDSANSALSHETFETITDPDGDAWRNTGALVYAGLGVEIADECVFFTNDFTFYNVPTFLIGQHHYAVQLVYSNERHACSSAP